MIENKIIKKISLSLLTLTLLLIIYLFPKDTSNKIISKTNVSVSMQNDNLYILDENNYVSRINISLTASNVYEKINEIILYLTEDSIYQDIIPNSFHQIIPKNTKILNFELNDNNLKINFSKEFLNVSKDNEEKLIEALIYSLTSLKEVDSITIYIENEELKKLPKSGIYLSSKLDRTFGINKIYNIDNYKDLKQTTLYYIANHNDFYYYVPVSKISNDNSKKIEIIIKELSSNLTYNTNLKSYLNAAVYLENSDIVDNTLYLGFNTAIFSDNDTILEEVIYSINLSIKDNYDVESVIYMVNDEKFATFDLKALEN